MILIRRWIRPVIVLLIVLFVLAYFVFPTRTWREQRTALADIESDVADVMADNEVLQGRIDALQKVDEIERIARRDFNLVYPGEEAYAILPPPPRTVTLPNAWPFTVLSDTLD